MIQAKYDEPRILIVDDNATDRVVLRGMLKQLGFGDVQEAEDGSIAESKIENALATMRPFQIVFLDVRMPKQGGISLLEKLRARFKTQDVCVFMMTATADLETFQTSLKTGIDDFIVKPFNVDVIAKKIKESERLKGISFKALS